MKTLVLLVCYGTGKIAPATVELRSLYAALRDQRQRDYLVIDNALVRDYCERLDDATTLIGGDNSQREFSAWNRALAFLGPRLAEYDVVHLATETLHTDYRHYLGLLTPRMFELIAERGICLGHIDAYPRPVTLFGQHSQAWIRSCSLLLPGRAVRTLGTFIATDGSDWLFTDDPQQPFHAEAPIDGQYQQYLRQWLTGESGSARELAPHREPFALTPETFDRFKAKVVAIVNEHALSMRLRAAGFPTIDVEWLYDMLLQRPVEQILWQIPLPEMLRHTGQRRLRLGITPP